MKINYFERRPGFWIFDYFSSHLWMSLRDQKSTSLFIFISCCLSFHLTCMSLYIAVCVSTFLSFSISLCLSSTLSVSIFSVFLFPYFFHSETVYSFCFLYLIYVSLCVCVCVCVCLGSTFLSLYLSLSDCLFFLLSLPPLCLSLSLNVCLPFSLSIFHSQCLYLFLSFAPCISVTLRLSILFPFFTSYISLCLCVCQPSCF